MWRSDFVSFSVFWYILASILASPWGSTSYFICSDTQLRIVLLDSWRCWFSLSSDEPGSVLTTKWQEIDVLLSLLNKGTDRLIDANASPIFCRDSGVSRKLAGTTGFLSNKSAPRALNLRGINLLNTLTFVYVSPLVLLWMEVCFILWESRKELQCLCRWRD